MNETDKMTHAEIQERLADIERRNGKRGFGDLSPPGRDRAFLLELRDREHRELQSHLANIEDELDRVHKMLDRMLLARRLIAGAEVGT